MEAQGAARDVRALRPGRLPTWLLAVVPLALIAAATAAFGPSRSWRSRRRCCAPA
jgi:hypothetical protein